MKNTIFKISALGFISSFLAACMGPQTQTQTSTKNEAIVALKSCSNCVAELKDVPGTRLLDLIVTSNDPDLEIKYWLENPGQRSIPIALAKGSFDGVIQLQENQKIFVSAMEDAEYSIKGGKNILPNETSAKVYLKKVNTLELLTKDFNTLTKDQKRQFIEVVGLYDIALNSPKMLFASKVAEADKEMNNFYLDVPKSFKDTDLHKKLDFLKSQMNFINKQINTLGRVATGIDYERKNIDLIKKVINN